MFQFLKYHSSLYKEASGVNGPIGWNFGKFLLDKEGRVIKYYSPNDGKIDEEVVAELVATFVPLT